MTVPARIHLLLGHDTDPVGAASRDDSGGDLASVRLGRDASLRVVASSLLSATSAPLSRSLRTIAFGSSRRRSG